MECTNNAEKSSVLGPKGFPSYGTWMIGNIA